MEDLYIGIDVGTAEVRAIVVDARGSALAEESQTITTWQSGEDVFEQSSSQIWRTICRIVADLLSGGSRAIRREQIKGIGVDATYSLVLSTRTGRSRGASPPFDIGEERDVILWRDKRAKKEAQRITSTGSRVLKGCGGTMDANLELTKILWCRNNMPAEIFEDTVYDTLCDALVHRMTGVRTRSSSSLVRFTTHEVAILSKGGAQYCFGPRALDGMIGETLSLLRDVNLNQQLEPTAMGNPPVLTAGQPVGQGLTIGASDDLGLLRGTPVGSGLVDSHAGWLGAVGASVNGQRPWLSASTSRLAVIAGTSTCFVVQSKEPMYVLGFWGPLMSSSLGAYWMNEGGQSASGALIDHIIDAHPASSELRSLAAKNNLSVYSQLACLLKAMTQISTEPSLAALVRHLHVYPDFAGNRSPLADMHMRGSISGLDLSTSLESLALLYFATLQSLAFQTRQNVELLVQGGHQIQDLVISGGLVRNKLLMQLMADICNRPILLVPEQAGAVARGAAICGHIAASDTSVAFEAEDLARNERIWQILTQMSVDAIRLEPLVNAMERRLNDCKYRIYLENLTTQQSWRRQMDACLQDSLQADARCTVRM